MGVTLVRAEPGGPIPNRQDVDTISAIIKGSIIFLEKNYGVASAVLEIPAGATPLFFDTKQRSDSEDLKRSFFAQLAC